jgi:hypothetical protein
MTNEHQRMPTEEKGIGAEIDLGFVSAQVGMLGNKVDRLETWWEHHSDIVYQTPLVAQITGTSGGLNPNDGASSGNSNLQPDLGTCWSVRRLTLIGYTAGVVTAYINAIEPVAIWTFGTSAPFTYYTKGALLLQPGDRLTLGAAGVTGTAQLFGVSDTFPYWYLRRYLD